MKVKLVFSDWLDSDNKSIYSTEEGLKLTVGDFHSGTTFECDIKLDEESEKELRDAIKNGFNPVFYVIK